MKRELTEAAGRRAILGHAAHGRSLEANRDFAGTQERINNRDYYSEVDLERRERERMGAANRPETNDAA